MAKAQPLFERITIIGLGLIGSSIARAVKKHGLADIVVGYDINEIALGFGRSNGFIDIAMNDAKTAAADSQFVILAVPPAALSETAQAIAPALMPGCIVMDTASVKQAAIEAIAPHVPEGVDFIPAHPIAGSEQTGAKAGRADLFARKFVIVSPVDAINTGPLQLITAFWAGMGAKVEGMPAHLHDLIYAYVSHLPQLLAYAAPDITGSHAPTESKKEALEKFLRLSRSNPRLWAEVFIMNKENIIKALEHYLKVISHIRSELAQAPAEGKKKENEALSRSVLFPRIAASSLITAVIEKERAVGVPFARYSGTGFTDFAWPASLPPDADIKSISDNCRPVEMALQEYENRLTAFHALLLVGDITQLKQLLPH